MGFLYAFRILKERKTNKENMTLKKAKFLLSAPVQFVKFQLEQEKGVTKVE